MIKFSIDYYDKNSFFKTLDYSNKIILSSTSDTLFIYNLKENKYVFNACKEMSIYGKKYIIELRDDLYFYDGKRVTSEDYYNAILKYKELLPSFSNNIDLISFSTNKLIINLKHNDKLLLNKLSFYLFSPNRNNVTSGRYYLSDINDEFIILKNNKYYRNKSNKELKFIKCEDYNIEKELFSKKIVDIDNNTFFELSNLNMNNEKSGIIISLEISTKISLKERKDIVRNINKTNISNKLGNSYFVKDDFFFNNIFKYKKRNTKKNGNGKILKLLYNEFYPNFQIASFIKEELEKNNYNVVLINSTYQNFKNDFDFDLKLTLNYFEYIDDLYFYGSKYFMFVMKNNLLYKFLVNHNLFLKLINKMFKNKYIKEPILSFYSNYRVNDITHDFSYLECNYDKLK